MSCKTSLFNRMSTHQVVCSQSEAHQRERNINI